MSADNGIYLHKFRKGWKVIHAQAIENIYWQKGEKKYNYNILYSYFKHSPWFKTKEEALEYAFKLHKEYEWTEYGICEV